MHGLCYVFHKFACLLMFMLIDDLNVDANLRSLSYKSHNKLRVNKEVSSRKSAGLQLVIEFQANLAADFIHSVHCG